MFAVNGVLELVPSLRANIVAVAIRDCLAKARTDHLAAAELDGEDSRQGSGDRNGLGRRRHATARYHHLRRGWRRPRLHPPRDLCIDLISIDGVVEDPREWGGDSIEGDADCLRAR